MHHTVRLLLIHDHYPRETNVNQLGISCAKDQKQQQQTTLKSQKDAKACRIFPRPNHHTKRSRHTKSPPPRPASTSSYWLPARRLALTSTTRMHRAVRPLRLQPRELLVRIEGPRDLHRRIDRKRRRETVTLCAAEHAADLLLRACCRARVTALRRGRRLSCGQRVWWLHRRRGAGGGRVVRWQHWILALGVEHAERAAHLALRNRAAAPCSRQLRS